MAPIALSVECLRSQWKDFSKSVYYTPFWFMVLKFESNLQKRIMTQILKAPPPGICPGDFIMKAKQINSQSDLILMSSFVSPVLPCSQILCLHHFNLRSLYLQSLRSLPNWIQLHTSRTSAIYTPFQWTDNKSTFFCYSLLLGQFQLKLFYCGKGLQNFASNITLYPCERSRQNHLG